MMTRPISQTRLAFSNALAFTIVGLTSLLVQGAELEVKDWTLHQEYLSPRALGMGNAFTAIADDYSALFYNPAGLARLTEGQINMGIQAMADPKIQKLLKDVSDVSKSKDSTQIETVLRDNVGKFYSARPTLNAFWARPKWALAIIPLDLDLNMQIRQKSLYTLETVATQDTTIAYGRGWNTRIGKSTLSFGLTTKAIYRAYYNRGIKASDLVLQNEILRKEDAMEGFTVDADFGMLWTPDISATSWWRFTKPSVGVVVRNVADYGFKNNFHLIDKATTQPPDLQRRYDFGTSFELPTWWVWKTRVAADLRDMGHENFTMQKGLHVGAEFMWKIRSWWQGGWRIGSNQGYFTAGATAKLGIFNLDAATTAEEVGSSQSKKSSRRYMLKASLDW